MPKQKIKHIEKRSKAPDYMDKATNGYGRIVWFIIIVLSVIAIFVSLASSDNGHKAW